MFQILQQEASIDTILVFMKQLLLLFVKNLRRILVLALLGGLLGVAIGFLKPVKRSAEVILAVEEEGASGFEGLMAQFGLDAGGSNPGGVFQGESLVKVFLTRSMIERALLSSVEINGDTVILANYIFPKTKLGKKRVFEGVQFTHDRSANDALTDSALYELNKLVRTKLLSVTKPDKRQGIIHVKATHRDPMVALRLSETLVKTVSDFYVETLTRKARFNLEVLQSEADSVQQLLNSNLVESAVESDLNVNPIRQTLRINQNRKLIDLQVSVSLYGEVVKNLKLAEIQLRKQTPLIQVIDRPRQPLDVVGFMWWEWLMYGAFAGAAVGGYLAYRKNETPADTAV
jgi:uncharacterized protein involved in exopolysaccharide biosynthesis